MPHLSPLKWFHAYILFILWFMLFIIMLNFYILFNPSKMPLNNKKMIKYWKF